MRNLAKRKWLAVGTLVLGSIGCGHSRTTQVSSKPCTTCTAPTTTATAKHDSAKPTSLPSSPTGMNPNRMPTAEPMPQNVNGNATLTIQPLPSNETAIPSVTIPQQPAKPMAPLTLPEVQSSIPSALEKQPESIKPETSMKVSPGIIEEKTPAKTIAMNSTVRVEGRMDHAKDYSWLVGKLEYSIGKKTWRVRYANHDQEDRFGGTVTLTGADHLLENYRDGDFVKVEGRLDELQGNSVSPNYWVIQLDRLGK